MKRMLAWTGFAAVSLAAVAALFFLPDVFGGLETKATLDRSKALTLAREKASSLDLGPPGAQEALQFANDDTAQAFVELKGGGLKLLNQEAAKGTYSFSYWTVRRFQVGQIFEASLYLSPSGTFLGWKETHSQTEVFPNLTQDEALAVALSRARDSGVADLGTWEAIETSSVTQPEGRIDWTFVWKKTPSPFGDGEVRWTATVTGNRVTALVPTFRVPDTFLRWYENERSVNSVIVTTSFVGMGLLLLLAGAAALRLGRTKQVAWKRSWILGGVLGLGSSMAMVNGLAQTWMSYDTALSGEVFWITQTSVILLVVVVSVLLYGFTLAGADALYRRSFPGAFAWGTRGSLASMDRSALGARVSAGMLAVPLWLLAVTAFYAFTKGVWGWWTPASGLADPNIVGQFVPWLTPLGNALQAAVWEEVFFRALPLALAVWAGQKWGRPVLWMTVALGLQAVVFAAGHAAYPGLPGWSRLVELIVPALAFGLIVLRWGLVPAILIHFGYDFVLMSQPIFTTDSPSLVPDRIAVVLVVLAVPAAALWNRFLRRDPPVLVESTPEQPAVVEPAAVSEAIQPAVSAPAPTLAPALTRSWVVWAALAIVGVVLTLVTWTPPMATLSVDRDRAQSVALKALADQGFVPGTHWTLDVSTFANASNDDRYVRSLGGEYAVKAARAQEYLDPPHWIFQWSDYTGDLNQRERWVVRVARADRPLRITRFLPESLPGSKLTKGEAVEVALAALPGRLGLTATADQLKSAEAASLPQRTDWTLDFEVPGPSKAWSARARVVVSGSQVTDAQRFVYLPEDWVRPWQQASSIGGIFTLASAVLLWVFLGWGVVRGFKAWSRKEFHGQAFLVVTVSVAVALTLTFVNGWSSFALGFSVAQPWLSQALPLILLVPLVFVVWGLGWGVMAGALPWPDSRWTRPTLGRFVPGLAVALALQGATGLITFLFPLGTSYLPDVTGAAGLLPFLHQAVLSAGVLLVVTPALFLLNRADALASRGRLWVALLLVFAFGVVYHGGLTLDTWQTALARMGFSSLVFVGLWFLVRRDPFSVVVALGAGTILGFFAELVLPSYPGSWVGALIGSVTMLVVLVAVSGWDWSRLEVKKPLDSEPLQ